MAILVSGENIFLTCMFAIIISGVLLRAKIRGLGTKSTAAKSATSACRNYAWLFILLTHNTITHCT